MVNGNFETNGLKKNLFRGQIRQNWREAITTEKWWWAYRFKDGNVTQKIYSESENLNFG